VTPGLIYIRPVSMGVPVKGDQAGIAGSCDAGDHSIQAIPTCD
jgi:hypothetical protein